MSVQVEDYVAVKPVRFKQLSQLCRGRFSTGHLKNLEDWTHLLTVSNEGAVAAFLLLDLQPYETREPVAMVRILCAGEKGTGFPQQLLAHAEAIAKGGGKTMLELELEDLSEKLVKVYTDAGFSMKPNDTYGMQKAIGGSRGSRGLRGSRVKKQTRRTQRKRRNTVRR
jgi:GNAT superfamily N-acetyltransferase